MRGDASHLVMTHTCCGYGHIPALFIGVCGGDWTPVQCRGWNMSLLLGFYLARSLYSLALEVSCLPVGLWPCCLCFCLTFYFRHGYLSRPDLFRPSHTRAFWGGVWRPAFTQARTPTACCRTLLPALQSTLWSLTAARHTKQTLTLHLPATERQAICGMYGQSAWF
jgi:hypothetical protein